jgi:HEAT repeat protein
MTVFCINCFAEIASDAAVCGRCGALQSGDRREYAEKLRSALRHPIAETRRRAVFLIGERRLEDATVELRKLAQADNDPYLAAEAVDALKKIATPNALTAIEGAARHPSFVVRAQAVQALALAGGKWRESALALARRDPSSMVRASAQVNSKQVRIGKGTGNR